MSLQQLVIYDSEEPCPYLEGQRARMPLRRPLTTVAPCDFDQALDAGDRRTGGFLYNTACPQCAACQPIRLLVNEFVQSRSQRRVWRKGQAHLEIKCGRPVTEAERLRLFNRHRRLRGLAHERSDIDAFGYEHFLVDSCCDTRELRYFHNGDLVGVAICDVGDSSLSAVYTYFEPECKVTSIGVYSILVQIELCRIVGAQHLYLGYFVADSPHMNYKSKYVPHERRIDGQWTRFDAPTS